jgi:hypothetical protein
MENEFGDDRVLGGGQACWIVLVLVWGVRCEEFNDDCEGVRRVQIEREGFELER